MCLLSAYYLQKACLLHNFCLCRVCAWLQRLLVPTPLPLQGQDLGGDPPEPDMGLHWDDREPCPFSREEGEAFCTYVASDMSRCHPKRRNLPGNRSKKHVCHTPTLYGGRLIHRMPQTICQWFMQIKCILYAHLLHTAGALCILGGSVQTVVVTNPTQIFAGSKGTICLSGLATMPTDPESFDLQIVGAW